MKESGGETLGKCWGGWPVIGLGATVCDNGIEFIKISFRRTAPKAQMTGRPADHCEES